MVKNITGIIETYRQRTDDEWKKVKSRLELKNVNAEMLKDRNEWGSSGWWETHCRAIRRGEEGISLPSMGIIRNELGTYENKSETYWHLSQTEPFEVWSEKKWRKQREQGTVNEKEVATVEKYNRTLRDRFVEEINLCKEHFAKFVKKQPSEVENHFPTYDE